MRMYKCILLFLHRQQKKIDLSGFALYYMYVVGVLPGPLIVTLSAVTADSVRLKWLWVYMTSPVSQVEMLSDLYAGFGPAS